jgi:glycosyltransferase involved in cell wall biosynthesis
MYGDRAFIDEIIATQRPIAARYRPAFGEGLFRAAFARIAPIEAEKKGDVSPVTQARVLVFTHFDGYVVHQGETSSVHGIPRVMRQVVRALVDAGCRVTVTSTPHLRAAVLRFYAVNCSDPGRITVLDTDELAASAVRVRDHSYAIVPHYHLLSEADELTIPYLLYLPDYLPHYFQGRGWFSEPDDVVSRGRLRAAGAKRILTNSAFSRRYLPRCKLEVPAERIVHFPLPYLGRGDSSEAPAPEFAPPSVPAGRFLYYPAQPHPNKRHDLLVLAWTLLNIRRTEPLDLVLTAGELPARLIDLVDGYGLTERLHLMPSLDDVSLEWLYTQAACMTIPSELEGNFPTQMLEALHLGCPIAGMDNPVLHEELGELACFLQIAPFGDVEAYADRIEYCLDHREEVLRLQQLAWLPLVERHSRERFCSNVRQLHESMVNPEVC